MDLRGDSPSNGATNEAPAAADDDVRTLFALESAKSLLMTSLSSAISDSFLAVNSIIFLSLALGYKMKIVTAENTNMYSPTSSDIFLN